MDVRPPSPFDSASPISGNPWGSRDTALVIEDNEGIATLLRIVLGKAGLVVIWCQTGQEAVEKFNLNHASIAVVISDCRLPDGDGREFCSKFRARVPLLPLLLSSGSAACLNLGPLESARLVRFMPKPYSPGEMLAHIEKLRIEARAASAAISAGFV